MVEMILLNEKSARHASEQLARSCETMEHLLTGLLDSEGCIAEEVHTIRKLGKSLRGGFFLLRLKGAAKEIQAIGRLLSEPRDAVSRLGTWGKLSWGEDAATCAAIFGLLEQQKCSAARRPPAETIAWCLERVAVAKNNLSEIAHENLLERLSSGAKKLRQHVSKRCRSLDHRGEEDFHDARKALKAYLGALSFLPEEAMTLDPKMNGLAETLGDENDLGTLSTWLEEHGFTDHFLPTLWLKLGKARHKLRKLAIREAAKLVH